MASTSRCTRRARSGAGAWRAKCASSSSTPKLEMAEPKNTGVCLPAQIVVDVEFRGAAAHQLDLVVEARGAVAEEFAPFRAVQSLDRAIGAALAARPPPRRRRSGLRAGDRCRRDRAPCRWARSRARCGSSSTLSTSSSSSMGGRPSRSSLLMKVMIGVSRSRQTSISLMVRSSTPLAQSMTMSALSTAVSVR